MFDEAGLAYPTADWTWDDLTEAARKLKKPDGSQYGFCLKPNNDQAGYYNMILDRGGYILMMTRQNPAMTIRRVLKPCRFWRPGLRKI